MQESLKAKEILSLVEGKGYGISVAESCTGGLLADAFVSIEGASSVFLGGLICYSLKSKEEVAGLSKEVVYANSAVNEDCSKAFAKASLEKFNSDYALSTTGFAEDSKEMYLSIASKGECKTFKKIFFGSRNEIRHLQVEFALSKFLEFLS